MTVSPGRRCNRTSDGCIKIRKLRLEHRGIKRHPIGKIDRTRWCIRRRQQTTHYHTQCDIHYIITRTTTIRVTCIVATDHTEG